MGHLQCADGDTAQVGPELAERLDIPQVTYVRGLTLSGETLTAERQLETGYEVIRVTTPVLLSAVKELNTPRYLSILGICEAYEKEIKVLSIADLDITPADTGLKASPTKVVRSFSPVSSRAGLIWQGDINDMTDKLINALREKHAI